MFDQTLLSIICLSCFLLASGLLLAGFQATPTATRVTRVGHAAFILGTIALSGLLVVCLLIETESGRSNHIPSFLFAAALAWVTVVVWMRWRMQLIGAFMAPVIALTLMLDIFFGAQLGGAAEASPPGLLLAVHIGSAIIGEVFAVAACGASLMLLWQQRKLKNRQLQSLPVKFPALDTLGEALGSTLWIGFGFITISLLSGAILTMTVPPLMGTALKLKTIWAILVWIWYLTILVLRHVLHYRAQKIARMSLFGFVLLAISWFGFAFAHAGAGL